ncbi:MAG TPA: lysylphosphatidylglycerol synthase transmembrane domain-containing protein [Acidimicrobiales bacterium]
MARVADRPATEQSDGTRFVRVPWSLFASAGDEPRRRRVDDVVLVGVAAVTVLAAALLVDEATAAEKDVVAALDRLLGWLAPVWSTAIVSATLLVLVIIVAAIAGGRRALVRDLVLAVLLPVGIGMLLTRAVEGRWPEWSGLLWHADGSTYPSLRMAIVAAVVLVAVPDLTRPVRYASLCIVGLCAVATTVMDHAYPSHVLGGLALGVGVGACVRLAFGSSAGFPHEQRVLADLAELGIDASDVWRDEEQRGGVARYRAVGRDGSPLAVAVYGRDARDSQFLARVWRMLWYRDAGPEASITRRSQVEHEGLMLFAAARAGVPVPGVEAAGKAGTGDALLVTTEPDAPVLAALDPDGIDDALLAGVWAAARSLRDARIGHGRLNARSLVVAPSGVVVTDLAGARFHADGEVLGTDLAELLVSCSLLVGTDRALAAARAAMGDEALYEALPYVQRAALSPRVRDDAHDADLDVDGLRQQVVAATGGELPEIATVRRVSGRDIALILLTAFAAYLLLGQLADIGLSTIIEELSGAIWGWVLLALALAQTTLLTDAFATLAAVGSPLPLAPTTVLQSAVKFINLTVPSTAGKIALTMRYLERQGIPRAVALTQGSIDGLAGFVVQALVLIIVIPLANIDLDLDSGSSGDGHGETLIWIGLALVIGAVVAGVLALTLPRLRARVWPFIHAALTNIRSLATSPGRLIRLFGANVATQLIYALTLGAAVQAFGSHASLADLLLVNTGVSLLGGVVPIPGAIGVAEAGLTAGLTAVGVPPASAMAAALVHRLCTYYLPPVWGWFSLRWLGRRGYV